jgi:hypothetical protein
MLMSRTVTEVDNKLEDMEPGPEEAAMATPRSSEANEDSILSEDPAMDASFMSESIYQKLPSPKSLKHKSISMSCRLVERNMADSCQGNGPCPSYTSTSNPDPPSPKSRPIMI